MQEVYENHKGDVNVIEVVENGMKQEDSAQEILQETVTKEPWSSATHPVLYVDPGMALMEDFNSAADFDGYPTVVLVDLQTMEVVFPDCYSYPTQWAKDFEACVVDHLK